MRILGLDIGGANLKAATADGRALSFAFPMWQESHRLVQVLRDLPADDFGAPDMIALTMTAELADCFQTKQEGVEFVIRSVQSAYPDVPVRVWLTSGEFAEPDDATELPMLVAAANWHALATWAGRAVPAGPALLVDIGSTTTDIIPLMDGCPQMAGRTDQQRMANSELVYTGAVRTPVCAAVRTVPWDGRQQPLAAELFATMLDIHLITGDVEEMPDETGTADGRPATRANALNRLAHMLCCDTTEISAEDLSRIASWISEQQVAEIAKAIANRVQYLLELKPASTSAESDRPTVLISGSSAFLARKAIARLPQLATWQVLDLPAMYRPAVASCACAFAVARLGIERCADDLLPVQPF